MNIVQPKHALLFGLGMMGLAVLVAEPETGQPQQQAAEAAQADLAGPASAPRAAPARAIADPEWYGSAPEDTAAEAGEEDLVPAEDLPQEGDGGYGRTPPQPAPRTMTSRPAPVTAPAPSQAGSYAPPPPPPQVFQP